MWEWKKKLILKEPGKWPEISRIILENNRKGNNLNLFSCIWHPGPYTGQHLFHSKNPLKCVQQESPGPTISLCDILLSTWITSKSMKALWYSLCGDSWIHSFNFFQNDIKGDKLMICLSCYALWAIFICNINCRSISERDHWGLKKRACTFQDCQAA